MARETQPGSFSHDGSGAANFRGRETVIEKNGKKEEKGRMRDKEDEMNEKEDEMNEKEGEMGRMRRTRRRKRYGR